MNAGLRQCQTDSIGYTEYNPALNLIGQPANTWKNPESKRIPRIKGSKQKTAE